MYPKKDRKEEKVEKEKLLLKQNEITFDRSAINL